MHTIDVIGKIQWLSQVFQRVDGNLGTVTNELK